MLLGTQRLSLNPKRDSDIKTKKVQSYQIKTEKMKESFQEDLLGLREIRVFRKKYEIGDN